MGYGRIVLGQCLLLASLPIPGRTQAGSGFSVESLAKNQRSEFQQSELIAIQQYYIRAPKVFIDDVIKKDRALPASAAASIARGKRLPRELIPFLMDSPATVASKLEPLPRGLERKVLGTRFLLLDSRLVVQDMVHLPTAVAGSRRK